MISCTAIRKVELAAMLLAFVFSPVLAANTVETVSQLTWWQDVSQDRDYTITSSNPFSSNAVVNITNTDHAVVILSNVRPSSALGLLAAHVKINGATAVNGQNCQVKIHEKGCIIMPYSSDFKPLTVYSEQNFGGSPCNDFGLEDDGGFMNTLTDAKLNNRIRSFRLKRGYMVTFSLKAKGRGYSRCFIAANADLEMASLPAILDRSITSYRVFRWNDTGKAGLSNTNDATLNSLAGSTWCYDFSAGTDPGIDFDCVSHQIHENWPGIDECGRNGTSAMLKTNNEPANTSDDSPATVEQVLANWEAKMATGKRLCCPSSHDGGLEWMQQFMEAIDDRGWRCDVIDCHGYWYQNLDWWKWRMEFFKSFGRPVWISEMCYGASWNENWFGGDTSGSSANQQKLYNAMKPVVDYLNSDAQVERYAWWNDEAACSRIIINGSLTTFGQYYASMNTGLAYTGQYDYVPTVPTQSSPSQLSAISYQGTSIVDLKWYEPNGEQNSAIYVERRQGSSGQWVRVGEAALKEDAAWYAYEDPAGSAQCQYRIHVVDAKLQDRYTDIVTPSVKERPEWTGSVAGEGTFYLYNVGAGQWLCAGNDWGTHSSLTSYGGIDMDFSLNNGKYTIDTKIQQGADHYLGGNGNLYTDGSAAAWTLTPSATDGYTAYTLSPDGGTSFLSYDGSSSSLILDGSGQSVNAQWILVTRQERLDKVDRATPDHPVDATFLLPGHQFGRNDTRNSQWQGIPSEGHPKLGGNNVNNCCEAWQTTFDVYQVLTDLPKGKYRLQFQGFYRHGGIASAVASHNGGTEQLNAVFYAGGSEKPLQSIFNGAGRNGNVGTSTSGISGCFPNGMSDASSYFSLGLYDHSLDIEHAADQLRIGFRKTVNVSNDWAIFDNVRITAIGSARLEMEKAEALAQEADRMVENCPDAIESAKQAIAQHDFSTLQQARAYTAAYPSMLQALVISHAEAEGIEGRTPYEGIVNPDATEGFTTGWTNSGGASARQIIDGSTTYTAKAFDMNKWGDSNARLYFEQALTNLPSGCYRISVISRGANNGTLAQFNLNFIDANGKSNVNALNHANGSTGGTFGDGFESNCFDIVQPKDGNATIRVFVESCGGAHWVSFTRFRLVRTADYLSLDETEAFTPRNTHGHVSLRKTVYSGWNTLCLPFPLTLEAAHEQLGEGSFYQYDGESDDGSTLLFSPANSINAHQPYLFNSVEDAVRQMEVDRAVLTEGTPVSQGTNYDFVGLYEPLEKGNTVIVNGDYVLGATAFHRAAGGNAMKAFRAYLRRKEAANGESARELYIHIDGSDPTPVSALMMDGEKTPASGTVYDLQGRRHQSSTLGRGLYITRQGKKVIVK